MAFCKPGEVGQVLMMIYDDDDDGDDDRAGADLAGVGVLGFADPLRSDL